MVDHLVGRWVMRVRYAHGGYDLAHLRHLPSLVQSHHFAPGLPMSVTSLERQQAGVS